MLIHKIMHLPHECLNPAKEFGEAGENDLANRMKKEFSLVKMSHCYSITSINDAMV